MNLSLILIQFGCRPTKVWVLRRHNHLFLCCYQGRVLCKKNPCISNIYTWVKHVDFYPYVSVDICLQASFLKLVDIFCIHIETWKTQSLCVNSVIQSKFNFYLIPFSHWMLCGGRATPRSNHMKLIILVCFLSIKMIIHMVHSNISSFVFSGETWDISNKICGNIWKIVVV